MRMNCDSGCRYQHIYEFTWYTIVSAYCNASAAGPQELGLLLGLYYTMLGAGLLAGVTSTALATLTATRAAAQPAPPTATTHTRDLGPTEHRVRKSNSF